MANPRYDWEETPGHPPKKVPTESKPFRKYLRTGHMD
jgi:hypothetical protein